METETYKYEKKVKKAKEYFCHSDCITENKEYKAVTPNSKKETFSAAIKW